MTTACQFNIEYAVGDTQDMQLAIHRIVTTTTIATSTSTSTSTSTTTTTNTTTTTRAFYCLNYFDLMVAVFLMNRQTCI